eukprot:scaffold34719_cov241-Amphora_coffeaeformis.AAC.3
MGNIHPYYRCCCCCMCPRKGGATPKDCGQIDQSRRHSSLVAPLLEMTWWCHSGSGGGQTKRKDKTFFHHVPLPSSEVGKSRDCPSFKVEEYDKICKVLLSQRMKLVAHAHGISAVSSFSSSAPHTVLVSVIGGTKGPVLLRWQSWSHLSSFSAPVRFRRNGN